MTNQNAPHSLVLHVAFNVSLVQQLQILFTFSHVTTTATNRDLFTICTLYLEPKSFSIKLQNTEVLCLRTT